jgi:hypothetical protein
VFVPLVVLGPALLVEYGFRDDYSILREVREEPGKVLALCASQGRLVYGLLLQASFSYLDGVPALAAGRLFGALLIGLAGAVVARTAIARFGWDRGGAVLLGALLTLLPAAQVIASWAICWPHAVAALFGVCAFEVAERGLGDERRRRLLVVALAIMIAATLTYQSNALLYAVPLAAGWLGSARPRTWRWLSAHLALVALALVASYVVSVVLFRAAGFTISDRVAIDWNVFGKLRWFTANALPEALGLYVLRDSTARTEPWYTAAQIASGALLLAACTSRSGLKGTLRRSAGCLVIIGMAYAVSFVAIERWAAYRTIWPLSGVVLVGALVGARRAMDAVRLCPSFVPRVAASAVVLVVALAAATNVRDLIAGPQAREWARMRDIASELPSSRGARVFVVLPRPADTAAAVRHLDEFGSLTADCDWAAREMFLQALDAVRPGLRHSLPRVAWQSGYAPPSGKPNGTVIDFRSAARDLSVRRTPIEVPRRDLVPLASRPVFR